VGDPRGEWLPEEKQQEEGAAHHRFPMVAIAALLTANG
jgi:hypothetical protein